MTTSIEVENVSKLFHKHYQRTLKQTVVAKMRGRKVKDTFWALDDVSFDVQQGEAIGLMGLNGSGKSTLLKHIMGVMRPTTGRVRTRGRVSGLIATGAGFHPEMTGRENIYMNAAILGMTAAETDDKFPAMAEFADIGDFMDTPVAISPETRPRVRIAPEVGRITPMMCLSSCLLYTSDAADE